MRVTSFAFTALMLASEVSLISAKRVLFEGPPTPVKPVQRDALEDLLRREAFEVVEPELDRRAPASAASSAAASAASAAANFNTPEWNSQTIAACTGAISSVRQSTNPTGMVACYNLPFLNTQTGVFQADLRLYQLTTMSGAFVGVQPNQISLALTYPDAAVSQTGSAAKVKRQNVQSIPGGNTNELQQFQFVGQVDKKLTLSKVSQTQQMALLIPSIQLSAASPADASKTITSNLTSADTVYFVNGVFKGQSAAGAAAASPSAQVSAKALAGAFVLPGTSFGIFPVGFIVTGTWTILFVAAVGYGTFGRMRFRRHYRGRVKRAATTL